MASWFSIANFLVISILLLIATTALLFPMRAGEIQIRLSKFLSSMLVIFFNKLNANVTC
jgi:hypothetical protein